MLQCQANFLMIIHVQYSLVHSAHDYSYICTCTYVSKPCRPNVLCLVNQPLSSDVLRCLLMNIVFPVRVAWFSASFCWAYFAREGKGGEGFQTKFVQDPQVLHDGTVSWKRVHHINHCVTAAVAWCYLVGNNSGLNFCQCLADVNCMVELLARWCCGG